MPVEEKTIQGHEENRDHVRLGIVLLKSAVAAGEHISFDVDIENPKEVVIDRVSVTLIQHLKVAYTPKQSIDLVKENLKNINRLKNKQFHNTFQLQIPRTTAPTFLLHDNSSRIQPPLILHYELKFEAHLSGVFTNTRLQLPLIITNHP